MRNTDRQRKRCWIAIVVCPFPVSFPKGDNLMNLVIKSCHLVKMARVIVPFIEYCLPLEIFYWSSRETILIASVTVFYSNKENLM